MLFSGLAPKHNTRPLARPDHNQYDLIDLQTYLSRLKRPYHVDGLGKMCFCFKIFMIPILISLFCHVISNNHCIDQYTLFVNFDLIAPSEFILKCLIYANNKKRF